MKYESSKEYTPKQINYDNNIPSYQSSYKYSTSTDNYLSSANKKNDLD